MSDILYTYHGQLYVNLTNRCPCACTFCVRSQTRSVGSAEDLWLEHEPSVEEVKQALENYCLDDFDEVVFCGYGEPICALDRLIEVADYIHEIRKISIRVNTNGLGDLIYHKRVAPLLKGHVDVVSISLNAPDAQEYYKVTRPKFGIKSFDAMLQFAKDCKEQGIETRFTVVDVIGKEAIARSKALAEQVGIPLSSSIPVCSIVRRASRTEFRPTGIRNSGRSLSGGKIN